MNLMAARSRSFTLTPKHTWRGPRLFRLEDRKICVSDLSVGCVALRINGMIDIPRWGTRHEAALDPGFVFLEGCLPCLFMNVNFFNQKGKNSTHRRRF